MRRKPNWRNLRAPQTWVAAVVIAAATGVPSLHFWGGLAGVLVGIGTVLFVMLIYVTTPGINFYCPQCRRSLRMGANSCEHCGWSGAA